MAKHYEAVAADVDDVPFGIVFDADAVKRIEMEVDTVAVFKQVMQVPSEDNYYSNEEQTVLKTHTFLNQNFET